MVPDKMKQNQIKSNQIRSDQISSHFSQVLRYDKLMISPSYFTHYVMVTHLKYSKAILLTLSSIGTMQSSTAIIILGQYHESNLT